MDRLAHDVVDAGGEQAKRVVERVALVEAENRRVGPFADHSRERFTLAAVADQKRLDRVHVDIADLADPFAKFRRFDAGRRDAFAIKTGGVASRHDVRDRRQ